MKGIKRVKGEENQYLEPSLIYMCTYYLYIGDIVVVCKKEIIIKSRERERELWVIFGVFLFS